MCVCFVVVIKTNKMISLQFFLSSKSFSQFNIKFMFLEALMCMKQIAVMVYFLSSPCSVLAAGEKKNNFIFLFVK